MRVTRRDVPGVAMLLVAIAIAGCRGGAAPTLRASTTEASPSVASSPAPVASAVAVPPEAALGVDGGEPVVGQLGSYTWLDAGSDSPWLPGAPIAVGAGEVLSLVVTPPTGPTSWRARYAPGGQSDGIGAQALGEGGGTTMSFPAPPIGRWTVALDATFDAGSATYYWDVEVR